MQQRRAPLEWPRDGVGWPHPQASSFVEAAGIRWHVQRMGSGPPLVLVHGTAASTHSFRKLMPRLAERYSVVAMDLPGHGFTELPGPGVRLTLPYMARAVAALMDQLALARPVAIGHSAGAAVLIEAQRVRHVDLGAIVGLNAALLPFGGIGRHLFPAMARVMMLNPFLPDVFAWRARNEAAVRTLIEGTGSTLDAEGLGFYRLLLQNRAHVAAALAMMAGWDLEHLERGLGQLQVPLILVAGAGDRAVPPETASRVRDRTPGSSVHVLPGLGHLAHEEAPDRVAELLFEVLAPTPSDTT